MGLKNAKQMPQVFYGLHMVPGLAEYREDGDNLRILIKEETTKQMDATAAGKPFYVLHVEEVDLDKLQVEAAGFAVESFFNKLDGMHWVKFLVVSDDGHEALRKGWKLSNAYKPKRMGPGGENHAVPYDKEVLEGEYEHFGIVPNPRYEESMVLTPEEFKAYNSKKEQELKVIANSTDEIIKGDSSMKLKFWEKKAVVNAKELDIENISVELPKSKKEKTISQLVNEMDEVEMNAASTEPKMANESDMVKIGDEQMSVKELLEKYNALMNPKNESEEEEIDADVNDESLDNEDAGDDEAQKKEDDLKAKKNAKDAKDAADADAAAKKKENFTKLKNAAAKAKAAENEFDVIETGDNMLARGKTRYGS